MRGVGEHLTVGERIAFYRRRRGLTQAVVAGLLGMSTDWLAKIERGRRKAPRYDKLAQLARVLRVPMGDLLGQPELFEDTGQQDDVPAVRDALMSPRRLSKSLFGSSIAFDPPDVVAAAQLLDAAWDDYQGGRIGAVTAALPGLLTTAQQLEETADGNGGRNESRAWAVSAGTHHLASTLLAKIGESDIAWLAAERAMQAAEQSDDPLVLASAARAGSHALLANGRFEDALELGRTTAAWLRARIRQRDPAAISLLGMVYLRSATAAARKQDRAVTGELLTRAGALAEQLGGDANHWHTSFGPTNVALHRLSAELDLENVAYVVEHGNLDVAYMPIERAVCRRIDFARGLSLAGRGGDAYGELREAERLSPQLVRNNPRVRETVKSLIRQSPATGTARSSDLFALAQRCRAVR